MTEDFWASGYVECFNCGHEWVAVWPLGAAPLQCPACGTSDTERYEGSDQEEPAEEGEEEKVLANLNLL